MPSTAVRFPRSSQPSTSMTTQRTPEPATQPTVRTAPYLTHIVTHHGQLTLIPPQNAGRIRSPKTKKKRQPDSTARDEPRFTTAVPPSASRRIHPQSAPNARVRRQAASQSARPTGDPVLDSESSLRTGSRSRVPFSACNAPPCTIEGHESCVSCDVGDSISPPVRARPNCAPTPEAH